MADFLDTLARDARTSIEEGYYSSPHPANSKGRSLASGLRRASGAAVIAELKYASPSAGRLARAGDPDEIVGQMVSGGAAAISVVTEPIHFEGSLETIARVRRLVDLPVLMKDIVLSDIQVEAAKEVGADAVLLILGLFDRHYCDLGLGEMIDACHSRGLEVLLEVHTRTEFARAVRTEADLIGINNRDLRTLRVDLYSTRRILDKAARDGRIVVSESGIRTAADVRFLHSSGAGAFLVGSALMEAPSIRQKLTELVRAL